MIRNLTHALVGAILLIAVGWLLAQPAAHKQMAGHPDARYAVLGLIAALALLVVASLVRAFRPKKKNAKSGSPYAYGTPKGR